MSLDRLLAHQSTLAANPDVSNPGWRLGVADNILEEIWERYGEGPVFSNKGETEMAFDREPETVNYIKDNYERRDRIAFVALNRSDPRGTQQFIRTAEEAAAPEFQRRLRALNANGLDILVSQNSLKPGATGRTKADIDQIRHLYMDQDTGTLDRIKAELPTPHHILATSPGRHQIIWAVANMPITDAERTLRAMAAQFGTDIAATDASRVLRVPGFRSHKYPELNHWVRDIATERPKCEEYRPSDFRMVVAPEQVRGIYANAGTQRAQAGTGTQSHKDWLYVMRGLENGKQPAELIAHLEATRQDKPNPRYYAEHTVEKALQRFMLQRAPEQSVGVGIG